MKKILILLAILSVGCSGNKRPGGLQLAPADSAHANQNNTDKPLQAIVYGNIENLDSTDFMLIPLGLKTIAKENTTDAVRKSYYEGDESSVSYSSDSKYNFRVLTMSNCNNIIFYNKQTEETHLLLKQPALISSFYFPSYSTEYKGPKFYFLLLGIRDRDSNSDGYINTMDAEKVFISDLSGKKMTRLTPENTQLMDWFIDVPTNNILMYVRTNSHADKVFDVKDEISILKSSITNPGMGEEIIKADIKNSIKEILKQIQ